MSYTEIKKNSFIKIIEQLIVLKGTSFEDSYAINNYIVIKNANSWQERVLRRNQTLGLFITEVN